LRARLGETICGIYDNCTTILIKVVENPIRRQLKEVTVPGHKRLHTAAGAVCKRDSMLGALRASRTLTDPQGLRPRDPNGGPMPASEQRQKKVALSVRVNDRDRDAIVAKAASSGLPIAEYVRRCALGRQRRLGSTRR